MYVVCPFIFHPLVLSALQIPEGVGLHWPSYSIVRKHSIPGAIFNHRTQPGISLQFMTEDEIRFSHPVYAADLLALYWLMIAMHNLFFMLSKDIRYKSYCLWVIDLLWSVKTLLSQKLGILHLPEGYLSILFQINGFQILPWGLL